MAPSPSRCLRLHFGRAKLLSIVLKSVDRSLCPGRQAFIGRFFGSAFITCPLSVKRGDMNRDRRSWEKQRTQRCDERDARERARNISMRSENQKNCIIAIISSPFKRIEYFAFGALFSSIVRFPLDGRRGAHIPFADRFYRSEAKVVMFTTVCIR